MKKWLCVFIVILLLSGCWDNAKDQAEEREKEDALAESITDEPGDVIKTLPYPTGISWISDIYADSATNTFWLLGESAATEIHLIQINSQTGEVLDSINFNDAPFFLNHASELTWDGTSFWPPRRRRPRGLRGRASIPRSRLPWHRRARAGHRARSGRASREHR